MNVYRRGYIHVLSPLDSGEFTQRTVFFRGFELNTN